MAMRFHRTLAAAISRLARLRLNLPVVLGGGVFQNRLLVELAAERLADHPQPVALPGLIPPNDGGLAAGQLAIAASLVSA
jgi:hydrogenase maturation protein HypF